MAEITPVSVTQQKTYDGDENTYKAVDKDLSTFSGASPVDGEVWLKLEFGRTYFIHTITIYHIFYTNWYGPAYSYWCAQSDSNYRYCKESHSNVDIAVYQGDEKRGDCGTLQMTYGLEQEDQIYTFTCNTEGDTVLLSKTSGHILVFEIVVTTSGNYSNQCLNFSREKIGL